MAVEWKREGDFSVQAWRPETRQFLRLDGYGENWTASGSQGGIDEAAQRLLLEFRTPFNTEPTSPDEQFARLEAQLEAALEFVREARATPLPE